MAREIYKEMVESKSGFTTGSTTPIAEAVAARLKAAGFPASDIFVGGVIPTKANVVVRYHGTGARKPILLLAHIDVVEAGARTGPPTHLRSSRRMDISMAAARWTTSRKQQ
jgi:acetylornithine deacetylase/succinyl-diaminopimelate desuccinylase-like protein